jgi:hypothetical protein
MGHLTIGLSSLEAKSGLAKAGFSGIDTMRVYIKLNGSYIQASTGSDYIETAVTAAASDSSDANTLTIDLSPASGYEVYVALGTKAATGEWTPKYYGSTDSFKVTAGVYTKKTLTANVTPFSVSPSSSTTFATIVAGTLWRVVGPSVTNGSSSASIASCGTVNSLSVGTWFNGASFASEPWINTSTGIYTVSGGSLVQRYSAAATSSGAVSVDIGSKKNCLLVFYYGDDVGFAYSNVTSKKAVDSTWTTGSLKSYLGSSAGASFKDLITDTSTFMKATALVVNGNNSYGFISTALGSYYYNKTIQAEMSSDVMTWLLNQLKSSSYAVTAYSGGKLVSITSLAFDSSSSPKNIYAGTSSGLFSSAMNISDTTKAGPASTNLSSVAASGTDKIKKLAAYTFGSSSYAAYVDGNGNLVILKDGAKSVTYPFYAYSGSSSGVSSLTFYESSGALNLAVANSDGLAIIASIQ